MKNEGLKYIYKKKAQKPNLKKLVIIANRLGEGGCGY